MHPDWTYATGWRFKKRPGVDYFLQELGRIFEIVVYTADHGLTVFPVLDALDPNGFIMYRLVRDGEKSMEIVKLLLILIETPYNYLATHFVDGHHVKSLDRLNRDLSKVIVIDWNPHSTKFHPENSFNLQRWDGDDGDTTLFDLTAFLKSKLVHLRGYWTNSQYVSLISAVVTADVDDVREVMTYYKVSLSEARVSNISNRTKSRSLAFF